MFKNSICITNFERKPAIDFITLTNRSSRAIVNQPLDTQMKGESQLPHQWKFPIWRPAGHGADTTATATTTEEITLIDLDFEVIEDSESNRHEKAGPARNADRMLPSVINQNRDPEPRWVPVKHMPPDSHSKSSWRREREREAVESQSDKHSTTGPPSTIEAPPQVSGEEAAGGSNEESPVTANGPFQLSEPSPTTEGGGERAGQVSVTPPPANSTCHQVTCLDSTNGLQVVCFNLRTALERVVRRDNLTSNR